MSDNTLKYTTSGPVRGTCGHKHRSIRTALDCLERDARSCRAAGGYSDRSIERSDGTPLDRDEENELRYLLYR